MTATWIARSLILFLLIAIIAVPVALRPKEVELPTSTRKLVVLTPHNEQIRYEFGRGFRLWHEKEFGETVDVDWRKVGGTGDILRLLEAQYRTLAQAGREDDGAGYDIVWGGGDYFFDKQLKRGFTIDDGKGGTRSVSMTQPTALEEAYVKAAFPELMIADRALRDPEGHWWGIALSTFGIVYNRDSLESLQLPEPKTWSDLGDPRYDSWVALADPLHSVSIRTTYEAIVQRSGWDEGWRTLQLVCANARYFAAESSQVAVDVSTGEVAAGMCIDFFARSQATSVGGHRLGFVAPAQLTIVNPDPAAVLRGAPHRDLAERFIQYLLTEQAQSIWCFRKGTPDGPERYELRRPPVRRDMYEKHLNEMVDKDILFDIASPLPANAPSYFDVLPVVLHAMAIDVHDDLQAAWRAVYREASPTRQAELRTRLHALPFTTDDLEQARKRWKTNPESKTQDRLGWTAFFRDNYRSIASGNPQ